jgi:catechol 2,3-dioxygenase-like lactoylglutathione lyase family enzyme
MRFDHLGILVADLEASRAFARDVLGLEVALEEFSVPEMGITGAFFKLGGGQLELLHLDDPGDRLPEGEPARIDHVAVRVDDLEAEAKRLSSRGVVFQAPHNPSPIQEPLEIIGRRHLWTRRETSGGYMVQLIQAEGER